MGFPMRRNAMMWAEQFAQHLRAHGRKVRRPSGDSKEYAASCPGPVHRRGDRNCSLSFRDGRKGVVLNCFTGCSPDDVLAALGIRWRRGSSTPRPRPAPVHDDVYAKQKAAAIGFAVGDSLLDYAVTLPEGPEKDLVIAHFHRVLDASRALEETTKAPPSQGGASI
jgi:hypothetical protein